jgi:ankyrin repeat protein
MSNKSKNQKEIAFLALFEAFEEGKIDDFTAITNKMQFTDEEILLKRDLDERTALHLVCKKGKIDFFNFLLPMYKKIPNSLDLIDEKGDTPLNLACSHGFDTQPNFDAKDVKEAKSIIENFLAVKGAMIRQLLTPDESGIKADIRKSFLPKKNTPLHWAVYYGDLSGGMTIYEEYPLSIFFQNNFNETPLELVFQKNLKRGFKIRSQLLAKQIIDNFVKALFNQDFDFIFKNCSGEDKLNFNEIYSLKLQTNTNELTLQLDRLMNKAQSKIVTEILRQDQKFINMLSKSAGFAKLLNNFTSNNKQLDKGESENLLAGFMSNGLSRQLLASENQEMDQQVALQNSQSLFGKNQGANAEYESNYNSVVIDQSQAEVQSKNDSVELNEHNNDEFYISQEEIFIYDETDSKVYKSKALKFLHKLLSISAQLNNVNIVKILILSFKLSPFVSAINDHSTIYSLSEKGKWEMLGFLLELNYKYHNSNREFDVEACINTPETALNNTPLHAACIQSRKKCFVQLANINADLESSNSFDWLPFELTRKKDIYECALSMLRDKERLLLQDPKLVDPSFIPLTDNINHVRPKYQYLIIARDHENDFKNSLVYKQLIEVQSKFKDGDFLIKFIAPMTSSTDDFSRFYFLLCLSDELMDSVADILNLRMLNWKKEYIEPFSKANATEFQRLRDFHIHQIILHILNMEFNVELFKKRGIIEDHFPVHSFPTLQRLGQASKITKIRNVFFSSAKNSQSNLRPFHSIAFYYGCDYGLYLAFNSVYITNLLFIAVFGLAFTIAVLVEGSAFGHALVPVYSLIITIWVTVIFEQWKRRENELAFSWNTTQFKLNEPQRIDFIGRYSIDPISKEITEVKKSSTFLWLTVR